MPRIYAHNCEQCRPEIPQVYARDAEHALRLIRQAKRVIVRCKVGKNDTRLFFVSKKEAIYEMSRAPRPRSPRLRFTLVDRYAFIGEVD